MTAYATRAPLQLINNPHMMSESRGNGRRTSARLGDKEDLPVTNGIGHDYEPEKKNRGKAAGGKQEKVAVNGASTKASAKRKQVFEEEVNGFPFTRLKKAKAEAAVQQPQTQEPIPEEAQVAPKPSRKSTRRKSDGSPTSAPPEDTLKFEKKRRNLRNSDAQEDANLPPLPVKRKRKSREPAESKPPQEQESVGASGAQQKHNDKADQTQPVEITFDATKISLPFADTPIIRRNQEMRRGAANGSRRSSLGMRGRRASSLIDTGKSNALPHDGVESGEFYKHIESEGLSEPRRMRQLLTWCGTRALGERPTANEADIDAKLAAREIQSQLLKDFSTRSDMSDWFSRNESTPPPSIPQPNPKNVSNLAKIQDLEQQIARLQTEHQTWESLLRPPHKNTPLLPPSTSSPASIDPSLLSDPTQQAALSTLHSFTPSDTQLSLETTASNRLQCITQTLEFSIDRFAHNIHALGAYKDVAERLADEALGEAARALERHDVEGRRRANGKAAEGEGEGSGGDGAGVGSRDVLRALSRVIDP